MTTRHFKVWPTGKPRTLTVPITSVYDNLVVSAKRYPNKPAIEYYGTPISYHDVLEACESLAGYLQEACGVQKRDRVILYIQNSPQYVIAFHAILRADAVVVPLNPMNVTEELRHYREDCGATVAIVGQELYSRIQPLIGESGLKHVVTATYSDYLSSDHDESLPEVILAPRAMVADPQTVAWTEALAAGMKAHTHTAVSEDMAILPYTSGTTGVPKGCIHPHRTVQANIVSVCTWYGITPSSVTLTALPLFHVTGMVHGMLGAIYSGAQMVIMTRWDRDMAAKLIERTRVTNWTNIATMVVDFLAHPNIDNYDISSLTNVGGGGATLPKAVGERLFEMTGVRYSEGYGLSETIAQTHMNPPQAPRLQCMGIPAFDVDARIIDPVTLEQLGRNEEGELIVHGPQVFNGYWNRPDEDANAFVLIDGKRFFRTGDIAKYDRDGYYYMVDRVKRMINAAGFKVWPSEVESILYQHPAIEQACVIAAPDRRRGESPKAFVILRGPFKGKVSAREIMDWSREQMAAYKVPREVEFVDSLPVSGTGKILWRKLQEEEYERWAARA
ncbi:long-chain fatty acid--CoA ligase [Alicyclobacillus dauci]|uniref:Long-chain fatty acid--CoA ligase n=1 Tax=Alicyclobacillus dauci TaxID=1475485 RepID=A0ABY6Z5J5_9BACL|nr:long-chain fatty acid--CoA ligase [Alicyclobacillus dauci]WAH37596.1 long-chain fatty acid--CoA ligase [Alicyclobacillus dauci]